MHILGITGGIATGKSTVTEMFADDYALTVSADAISRDLLAPGTDTTRAVLAAFPDCANANGSAIDRRALGRVIFADAAARKRLEALTHPAIIATLQTQIDQWREAGPGIAAAEIPLLFEADLEYLVDAVVVVACTEGTQVARLCARQDIDEAEARRRLAAQWSLPQKIDRADFVITTDGDLDDTRRQVEAIVDLL